MSHLAGSRAQVLGDRRSLVMSQGRPVRQETGVCRATILVSYAGLVGGED